MRPKTAESVPEEAWKVLATIRSILETLPEEIEFQTYILGVRIDSEMAITRGKPNCHAIARAVAIFLPVDIHDGYVQVLGSDGRIRQLEHSWLTLKDSDRSVIIDSWPLGVATGPAIFIQDYAYHFGPECSFLQHRTAEFQSQVDAIVAHIALDALTNSGTIAA
jgi:hypothetical protein